MHLNPSRAYILPLLLFSLLLLSLPCASILQEQQWRSRIGITVFREERKFDASIKSCLLKYTLRPPYDCINCGLDKPGALRLCGRSGRAQLYSGEVLRKTAAPAPLIDWAKHLVEGLTLLSDVEAPELSFAHPRITIHGGLKLTQLHCTLAQHVAIAYRDMDIFRIDSAAPCQLVLFSIRGRVKVTQLGPTVQLQAAAWDDLILPETALKGTPLPIPLLSASVESLRTS